MNTLLAYMSPHKFSTEFNTNIFAALLQMPTKATEIALAKLCSSVTEIVKRAQSEMSFNSALRVLLVDPSHFQNFPCHLLDGFIKILTIPVSEAIAETQGSNIDALHLRYKNTDNDDKRLQKELKVKLMGPEPCSS